MLESERQTPEQTSCQPWQWSRRKRRGRVKATPLRKQAGSERAIGKQSRGRQAAASQKGESFRRKKKRMRNFSQGKLRLCLVPERKRYLKNGKANVVSFWVTQEI